MLLPVCADADSAQLQEELLILQSLPHMAWAGETHSLAVTADTLLVEYRQVHLV